MSTTPEKLCARDHIIRVLEQFPSKSHGKNILKLLKNGEALYEYQMNMLVQICKMMGLNVFTADVLKHSSGYFVTSDCKHSEMLTELYKEGNIYSPIKGLIALGKVTYEDSATHLFDEDILLQ